MTLRFQPAVGVLICDFPKEFTPPEMVKRRPVLVVSPPHRTRFELVTIIPLSTTPPKHKTKWDVEIELPEQIAGYESLTCWAKCDMIYNFKFGRLNLPLLGKGSDGKRMYQQLILSSDIMKSVYIGLLAHLGLNDLIEFTTNLEHIVDNRPFPF